MAEYADEMRAQSQRANGFFARQGSTNPLELQLAKAETELVKKDAEIERLNFYLSLTAAAPGSGAGHKILVEVAKKYKISVAELKSIRRNRSLVLARQEAMWLMRTLTSLSYPQIGNLLGGRDHTTALYGVRRHESRLRESGE